MFRHVLVPLDLGGRNRRLLEVAHDLAAGGARITLMHVIQRIEGIPAAELRGFYARLEKQAHGHLERAARHVSTDGARATLRLVVGDPAAEILREAQARRVDCIVLGSHRVGPRVGRGLGTTSYKVGILCRCPVLLVK